MLEEDHLGWLLTLRLALVFHHLVVLGQLNLVGLYHLRDFLLLGLLEAGEHLHEVDGHSKDIFGGSDDLFILLGVVLELLVEVDLSAVERVLVLLEGDEARHFHALYEGLVLLDLVLG